MSNRLGTCCIARLIADSRAFIQDSRIFRLRRVGRAMRRLVIVKRIAEIPNVVVLAHPGLGTSIFQLPCNQFRDFVCALVDWPVLSKSVGVVKFVDVEARQMAELDSYADHPAHYGACGMAAQPSVRY